MEQVHQSNIVSHPGYKDAVLDVLRYGPIGSFGRTGQRIKAAASRGFVQYQPLGSDQGGCKHTVTLNGLSYLVNLKE